MIGEIDPRIYDCEGRIVSLPWKEPGRLGPHDRALPVLAGDLTVQCSSLEEIQEFLRQCSYVSDADHFGIKDYWLHPRNFERSRKGDCEDFALWTWRQLLSIGYDARFVCGSCGGNGHAWVTFSDVQKHYLLESTAGRRRKLSRLRIWMYEPEFSYSIEGDRLVCWEHEQRSDRLVLSEILVIAFSLVLFLPWLLMKMVRKIRQWSRSSVSIPPAGEKDLEWQDVIVAVNDLLPDHQNVIDRLLEAGIPVGEVFGSSLKRAKVPEKRLITFGANIPPERIRDIIRAAGDFLDFIQVAENATSDGNVYIGSYGYRLAQPMAKLTPELREILSDANLSIDTLREAMALSEAPCDEARSEASRSGERSRRSGGESLRE